MPEAFYNLVFFFLSLSLTQLPSPTPCLSFILSLYSLWKQCPAPSLCFPMVLAVECVPVKGDIYLLLGRERRPSLPHDTDRREESRLNTSSQRHYSATFSLHAEMISEIRTVKTAGGKSYNNVTGSRQRVVCKKVRRRS